MSEDPDIRRYLDEIKDIRSILTQHENRLARIEGSIDQILKIAEKNQDLLRYVVVGLLAIVGAVVGLKLWTA